MTRNKPESDFDDRLLDSALEEILGGMRPPDQTREILEKLELAAKDKSVRQKRGHRVSRKQTTHARDIKSRREFPWVTIGIMAVGIGCMVSIMIYLLNLEPHKNFAIQPESVQPSAPVGDARESTSPHQPHQPAPEIAQDSDQLPTPEIESGLPNRQFNDPNLIVDSQTPEQDSEIEESKLEFVPELNLASELVGSEKSTAEKIIAQINQHFIDVWNQAEIKPGKALNKKQWQQVVFHKLIGRAPDPREINRLRELSRSDFVDRLMNAPVYQDAFAASVSSFLADAYNDSAKEIVKNSIKSDESHMAAMLNPLVDGKISIQLACRTIMERHYSCAKCHDDMSDTTKDQFKAFSMLAQDMDDHQSLIIEKISQSDAAKRMAVNQLWSFLYGFQLTDPSRELAFENPYDHRKLVDTLATQFSQHDLNTKKLLKWMVLSQTMSLPPDIGRGANDIPDRYAAPVFVRRYDREFLDAKPRRALATLSRSRVINLVEIEKSSDTVLGNVSEAKRQNDLQLDRHILELMKQDIGQIQIGDESYLGRISNNSNLTTKDRVNHIFWAQLGRPPRKGELELCEKILETQKGNHSLIGLRNLWWVLSKSKGVR